MLLIHVIKTCTFYIKNNKWLILKVTLIFHYLYLQEFYTKLFSSSRLQIHSGLDMSNHSMEAGLNLFFIPRITNEGIIFHHSIYFTFTQTLKMF